MSLELWGRFSIRCELEMYSIKPRVVYKTRQPCGKKMLCFCHVVRLCVAEQGADFVTLKYTRKVLWWAAGKKKGGGGGVGGGVDTLQCSNI